MLIMQVIFGLFLTITFGWWLITTSALDAIALFLLDGIIPGSNRALDPQTMLQIFGGALAGIVLLIALRLVHNQKLHRAALAILKNDTAQKNKQGPTPTPEPAIDQIPQPRMAASSPPAILVFFATLQYINRRFIPKGVYRRLQRLTPKIQHMCQVIARKLTALAVVIRRTTKHFAVYVRLVWRHIDRVARPHLRRLWRKLAHEAHYVRAGTLLAMQGRYQTTRHTVSRMLGVSEFRRFFEIMRERLRETARK